MQTNKFLYWASTGLLCAFLVFSAFGKLSGNEEVAIGFAHVGYPASMAKLLGVLMLGAVAAILSNISRDVKIAAYAGVMYYGLGIIYAHMSVGDSIGSGTPIGALILLLATTSYFFWKRS